jgi:hypothetical protein
MSSKKDKSAAAAASSSTPDDGSILLPEPAAPIAPPALVVQEHGGALLAGGKPGNAGGGRMPSIARAACLEAFENRIHILKDIADGVPIAPLVVESTGDGKDVPVPTCTLVPADVNERIKAIDLLGKYGLGAAKDISKDVVIERLQMTLDEIQKLVSAEQFDIISRAIQPIWA